MALSWCLRSPVQRGTVCGAPGGVDTQTLRHNTHLWVGTLRRTHRGRVVVASPRASDGRSSGPDTTSTTEYLRYHLLKRQGVAKTEVAPYPHGSLTSVLEEFLPRLLSTVSLVSPFFFWGTSMVLMKDVISHTSPLFLASLRLIPAGIALVAWAAASGRRHPSSVAGWSWVLLFALVDAAAFQGCLAEGLQRTSAGLGSVIIDSQPLTVAVLAAVLFGERLGPAALTGLGLGVLGLLLLEVPPELLTWLASPGAAEGILAGGVDHGLLSIPEANSSALWDNGEWWMLLAAQAMALGTVMIRWVTPHVDPVMATGWHMLIGGMVIFGVCCWQDPGIVAHDIASLTWLDGCSMAYASLLGGAASYGLFFYNASRGSLTALSSLTFLTPVFAAGAGYLALHETLTPMQLTGAVVTLSAVSLINKRPAADDEEQNSAH